MMLRRSLLATVCALATVGALIAVAQPAVAAADTCRVGKPVVNINEKILHTDDSGIDGHVWALDTYHEVLQMWRTGDNSYCAIEHQVGQFTTFVGPSPALTGTVPDGLRGVFSATFQWRVTGTFAPRYPKRGHIGTINAGCDRVENCKTFDYRFTDQYFSEITDLGLDSATADYASPCHGHWHQTLDSSRGDIVG
jgi:hypothetical protein